MNHDGKVIDDIILDHVAAKIGENMEMFSNAGYTICFDGGNVELNDANGREADIEISINHEKKILKFTVQESGR